MVLGLSLERAKRINLHIFRTEFEVHIHRFLRITLSALSLTLSKFLASLATLLAGMAALNIAVVHLTRNSLPKQVLARSQASKAASVIAIGNSLVAAGFDEDAFDSGFEIARPAGSVNLGLGASTPTEHLLILRSALRNNAHPNTIVYGFYDLQLTEPEIFRTSDLFGNHAMLYYTEPAFGAQFFRLSLHDRVEFVLMRHIPMIVERGAIWAKVERFRRKLAELGTGKELNNRFGRVGDFSLLEAPEASRFSSDCASANAHSLNIAVREMIRESSDHGIKMVFVEMPMHPYHVRTFYYLPEWHEYTDALRMNLASQNVKFIDASRWIASEQDFADHLHLSPRGASEFSERLGNQLREP